MPHSSGNTDRTIARNRKAHFDFQVEDRLEAGIVLEGWEVKSLRQGKGQIAEAYVVLRKQEAYLLGATITPLPTASTHIYPDPSRTRKLLLHRKQLDQLQIFVERKGYTIVPLDWHWSSKGHRIKLNLGLAKGKKQHDKRHALKERDWEREKQRLQKRTF